MYNEEVLTSILRSTDCDFWNAIKALKPKKESLPITVGGTSGDINIANLWKDHFSEIANSVGSTNNQHQIMNALGTVLRHNDVINVHELLQIVRGPKNKKAVGNDGILYEVYLFASERLLTMMSHSFPVVCLLVRYRVPLYT